MTKPDRAEPIVFKIVFLNCTEPAVPLESLFLPEFLDLLGFLDLEGFLNPLEFLAFCLALKPDLEKGQSPRTVSSQLPGSHTATLAGLPVTSQRPSIRSHPFGHPGFIPGNQTASTSSEQLRMCPQVYWGRPWPPQSSQAFFCSWWCKLSPELSQDYFLDRLIIPSFLLSHPIKPQHCPPLPWL